MGPTSDTPMQASTEGSPTPRTKRRPSRRRLPCPAHPEQQLCGNGRKYFLHLLTPAQLRERGMSDKRARLVLNAYPVLVLSNEWLEELYCPSCAQSRWCHVTRHGPQEHGVRWAPRDLWQQVAHVDAPNGNPSVSQYTLRAARRAGRGANRQANYFEPR